MASTRILTAGCLATLACVSTSVALAGYDEIDAQRDCERRMSADRRYAGTRDVNVRVDGSNSYTLTGVLRMEGRNGTFRCKVRHKEVVSWHIYGPGDYDRDNDDDDDKTAAIAVGAGVLAVAAIAALAAADDDDDDEDFREAQGRYASGQADPFDDIRYLKKQCRKELKRHLNDQHQRVERLNLQHVRLVGRELRGDGDVMFDRGYDRHLSFECEFDRAGRIHDGHYHFH